MDEDNFLPDFFDFGKRIVPLGFQMGLDGQKRISVLFGINLFVIIQRVGVYVETLVDPRPFV